MWRNSRHLHIKQTEISQKQSKIAEIFQRSYFIILKVLPNKTIKKLSLRLSLISKQFTFKLPSCTSFHIYWPLCKIDHCVDIAQFLDSETFICMLLRLSLSSKQFTFKLPSYHSHFKYTVSISIFSLVTAVDNWLSNSPCM